MKNCQKGQSLFEVVFTLAIIALITSAMVLLATFSIKNASYSKERSLATHYSQETIEWLRGQRDEDWTAFFNHVPPIITQDSKKNCLPALSWPSIWTTCVGENDLIEGTPFNREIQIPEKSANLVSVKIIISWTNGQGLHEVSTYTDFTNWKGI